MYSLLLTLAAVLAPQGDSGTHNILVVLLDDVGVDQLRLTADPSVTFPPAFDTPNIDAIAAKGVSFENGWVNPLCSPTRATIQTGQYAFRSDNGIGQVIERGCCTQFQGITCQEGNNCCLGCGNWSLPNTGKQLPNMLPGYLSGAFGKWHLEDKNIVYSPLSEWPELQRNRRFHSNRFCQSPCRHERDQAGPRLAAPCRHGYDFFGGTLWGIPWLPKPQCQNHLPSGCPPAEGSSYCTWGLTQIDAGSSSHNRTVTVSSNYMPKVITDLAGSWINAVQTLQPGVPWFCYLAPQTPFQFGHIPPNILQDVLVGPACTVCLPTNRDCYLAALEAFDDRLGALLDQIGPAWWTTTTIIFVGDNGTPQPVSGSTGYWPEARAKTTLYNGGVNVPFIVAGKAVDPVLWGITSSALVNSVDIYATVVELSGGTATGIDGVSLAPYLATTGTAPRTWIYAEKFEPNGSPVPMASHEVAIRDVRYKLKRKCWDHGQDELFDLQNDIKELSPLPIPQVPSDSLYFVYNSLVSNLPGSCQ